MRFHGLLTIVFKSRLLPCALEVLSSIPWWRIEQLCSTFISKMMLKSHGCSLWDLRLAVLCTSVHAGLLKIPCKKYPKWNRPIAYHHSLPKKPYFVLEYYVLLWYKKQHLLWWYNRHSERNTTYWNSTFCCDRRRTTIETLLFLVRLFILTNTLCRIIHERV